MKKERKPYTLTEAALEQRRAARKSPRKRLKGNLNAFKDGSRYSEKVHFGTKPLNICEGCLYFEIIKGRFEMVVFKVKK